MATTKASTSSLKAEVRRIPDSVIARLDPIVKKVFSDGDFHRVDMRTIARAAGMSFATIYRHFADKERLLFWFIAHWLTELEASAIAALNTEGSALERIERFIVAHFAFYESNPEVGRIIFMTVPLERWMRESTYAYREPTRRLRIVIEEGQKAGEIRSDVHSERISDLFTGMFNRTFLMWEYRGRTYSLTEQYDALLPLIESGVKGKVTAERARRKTSSAREP
ncbi:MAG: TetR/AcrR family transcriptional regulator [Proteobacteria bacterium]|jgi:AcrR family transcriptional regulator|nr:TetR/AcrR family transcriptional regulator [Pseudomonadota bacterium]